MRRVRLLAAVALCGLFPLSWAAPLLHTALLPSLTLPDWLGGEWFAPEGISVLSGLATLWDSDRMLALVVAVFALLAPMAKCLGLVLHAAGWAGPGAGRWLWALGRLAMADVFLLALTVVVAKGIGLGEVVPGWGAYLFTLCVLVSLLLSWERRG